MTVRAAKFTDIPSLVELMRDAHARSRDAKRTTFDEIEAKQLLVRCIQRHGQNNYMGTMVLVSETRDTVYGFVIGIIDQVYPAIKELKVTDLLIVFAAQGADPRDFRQMLLTLGAWGRDNPKVVKVLLGVTEEIDGIHWQDVGKLYEAEGFEHCGGFYRIEFDRDVEVAHVQCG